MLRKYTRHWRQWIQRTNVNDVAYGRGTISFARSDGSTLIAGAIFRARRLHRASLASLAIFDIEACSNRNHNCSECDSAVSLQHPSQSRWISSSRPTTQTQDRYMGNFTTIEELAQMAYVNLDAFSPRDKSAFWTILAKLLQNRGGKPSRTNHQHGQMKEQLETILCNTLGNIGRFSDRDIATTALGMAKIVKQVGQFRGRKPPTGSPHQILHDLLVGVKSDKKPLVFGKIAISSIPVLPEFEARHLSNLVYACGLAEFIPKIEGGRTFFDILALEAISKLHHFNSQDLSNMLWAYTNVGASNLSLFKAAGDSIVAMENLSRFKPQELSNIMWAYATAGESHPRLFMKLADHIVALDDLSGFTPQALSNIIWAYSTAGETHPRLFEKFSDHIVALENLRDFWPQALSNITWAYSSADETHPRLFKKFADHIIALDDLSGFNTQAISNIIWAYANVGEAHPRLFGNIADRIVALENISSFNPQAIANIIWAYSSTGESHPLLFKKFADHIVALDDLSGSKPQEISSTIWAYANAGESHPRLFKKFADYIVDLKDLSGFDPQALSNIIWAYATAGESHPILFQKFVDVAIKRCNEFNSQEVANFLWAFATIGQTNQHLFSSFAPTVKSIIGKLNSQEVTNIGWAYAVSNVYVQSLFDADFISVCLEKDNDFCKKSLSQLHQWQLWQEELKSDIRLPPSLREKCQKAFVSTLPSPSKFQDDVISELSTIGLNPEQEVLTKSGYRLDALVEVRGKKIGIEVDGPSHFVRRKPTGSTLLKRRQVNNLDKIPVISVPGWEWYKLGKDRGKKQQYLRFALGLD